MSRRLVFVCELFHPDQTSSGRVFTEIAAEMARTHPTLAICNLPTYAGVGEATPRRETYREIEIVRVAGTQLNKNILPLRVINAVTISRALKRACEENIRVGDLVIVGTNPPLVPALVQEVCQRKGAEFVLLVHDVYPDALLASGLQRESSPLVRKLQQQTDEVLARASGVITIGRDMTDRLAARMGDGRSRLVELTNWADADRVTPQPREAGGILEREGLTSDLVFQHAGNMGRTHGLELVLRVAESLPEGITVTFVGGGAMRPAVAAAAARSRRVRLMDFLPAEQMADSLAACDVALISFAPGMSGVSVPSRMYNVFASGRASLAVCEASSELGKLIDEHGIGRRVEPGDAAGLARALTDVQFWREQGPGMGERARDLAVGTYERSAVLARYRAAFEAMLEARP